jgi:hypothetical protein
MTRARVWLVIAACLGGLTVGGCAPKLRPLGGAPVPARLPRGELPPGARLIVFNWSLEDPDFVARGEGAARVAPPDSARLDFFLAGGLGRGAAVLIDGAPPHSAPAASLGSPRPACGPRVRRYRRAR